jgi:alkylation response protein AidB-like acyl-CoA dehydrogenase
MTDFARTISRLGFELTDEQTLAFSSARDFAERRLGPRASELDTTGRFPIDAVRELAALGLHAMRVPADDGGPGIDNVAYALSLAAIASSCAATAVSLASSNLSAGIVAARATSEQKRRWLEPYLAGELGLMSFALSEPGCGSNAAALTTSALLDGKNWVLDGNKMWTTNATHAGLHLVFARSDGPGGEGVSAFVVERGTSGLGIGKEEDKMGQRASGTAALHFDGCRLPLENLLGERGKGYTTALGALAGGRVGIAGLALGIAESALALGLGYARERVVFGRPLAEFQNTEFVLADCRTELDAAWLLTLRAARLLDAGERAVSEASMAKLYASEAAGRVVDRMLQLHGGYGYSRDYTIERLYRDVRVTRIYEGTSEVQRVLIARQMLREA